MRVFFNSSHDAHDGQGEMHHGRMVPCFDNARRMGLIRDAVALAVKAQLVDPADHGMAPITAIHDPAYLAFIENAWRDWQAAGHTGDAFPYIWPTAGLAGGAPTHISARLGQYAFSSDTPITPGTWKAAYWGAQTVVSAADAVMKDGEAAFALTRPPGHHAHANRYGGYCFLNNCAIAAQYMRDKGAKKIVVLDVDYHHGNGTQDIFYERADVLTVSIHADPKDHFPFFLGFADETGRLDGQGANLNIPLPGGTDFGGWSQAFARAMQKILGFQADALVVALGVDAHEAEPICDFKLVTDDFNRIGQMIGRLGLKTLFVMEGGYAHDVIGQNVAGVLGGYLSQAKT
ncbi:histone deacetylase family protein [Thalassospira sp.]|uniref:histone deacetylase family protein n=1 Tax=Thalassospira sp. TaxID=1912094 RepID=UPI0027372428|nr:histone deacetylase family protein [Thalassospira sp.]MDP2698933.1 histone deacetylase family protein [Thalassospira sp.]